MTEYEGIVSITWESDTERPPYDREPHSTVWRFIAVRCTTTLLAVTTLFAAGCGASRPTTFAARTAYTAHVVSSCRTYVDQQILVVDTQSRGAGIAVQRVDSTLARCDGTRSLARIDSSGYGRAASAARSALRAYEAWAYAALAYYRGQASPEHVDELQHAADDSAERSLALINGVRHRVGLAPVDDRELDRTQTTGSGVIAERSLRRRR